MFAPFCNDLHDLLTGFFFGFNIMDMYLQHDFSEMYFTTEENKHGQLVFPLLPW